MSSYFEQAMILKDFQNSPCMWEGKNNHVKKKSNINDNYSLFTLLLEQNSLLCTKKANNLKCNQNQHQSSVLAGKKDKSKHQEFTTSLKINMQS